VVHRTVAENATSTQFPMLTHTNYQEWVMLMQVNFEAAGGGTPSIRRRMKRSTTATIDWRWL
jgi:hypothetical protein